MAKVEKKEMRIEAPPELGPEQAQALGPTLELKTQLEPEAQLKLEA